jgi:hypothetical protein
VIAAYPIEMNKYLNSPIVRRVYFFTYEKCWNKPFWLSKSLVQEVFVMEKKEENVTAPNNPHTNGSIGGILPNSVRAAGESVDKLRAMEETNTAISGNEIGQQNENL